MDTSQIQNLRNRAIEIKEATERGENTADRVGGLLKDIIDYDEAQSNAITNAEQGAVLMQPLLGINAMRATPLEGQSIKFFNNKWIFYTPSSGGGGGSGSVGLQKSFFLNIATGTVPVTPLPSDYNSGTKTFNTTDGSWTVSNTNPTTGQDTWAIWVWFSGDSPQTISGPLKVFDGATQSASNGTDGDSIEWVYMRTTELLTSQAISDESDKLQRCTTAYDTTWSTPGKLPTGWNNHPSGIDSTNKYEYAACRVSSNNSTTGKREWGNTGFYGPLLWSAYGEKGMDGDGVEYIFYANNLGYIPIGDIYNPVSWTNDEGFQNPEYIRDSSPWMDEPIDLYNSDLGQGAIEWVSIRKKQDGVWQPYSVPAVWSRLAKDGIVDGYVVDLSNENMPVGTDTEGHAANYSNKCSVTVFHNNTPLNYGTDVGEFSLSVGTITRSDDVAVEGHITANQDSPNNPNDIIVSVDATGIDNFSGKNAFVPITVTLHDGISHSTTRNLVITLFGTVTGKDGNVIDLYTETASVHLDATKTSVIPSALNVGVRIGSGDDYTIYGVTNAPSGYSFKYFYDGDTEHLTELTTNSIEPLTGNHTSLSVRLLKDGVRIDEERLPYIVDGADGRGVRVVEPFYHADASNNSESIYLPEYAPSNYWYSTIEATGWNSTNKYLWKIERTTYTNGISDWGTISLYLTWVNNGQGQFKSIVFCRKNSAPSTPSNSTSNGYNTYTNPIPPAGTDGWSDGIPSGSASIWASHRVFTSDGQSPQDANWSTPSKMQDSTDYDVEFSFLENPGNPTDNPNNWYDPSDTLPSGKSWSDMIWRAERHFKNGSWGNWTIEKIKGEQGPEGASGYSIIMNPSSLIINESITYDEDETEITGRSYDINYKKVTIQIKKEDTPQKLYRSNLGCYNNNNTTCNYVSAGAALSSDTKTLTVYISGISDSTITEGYIQLTVGVTPSNNSPFAQTIKIPFYINRQESTLFAVKGELKTYASDGDAVVVSKYTEALEVTQKRLTSQFTESIGTIGSRNFFGFTNTKISNSSYPCVPFIQGYGVVINGSLNGHRGGRVQNLGFNGIGGTYTVSCWMKRSKNSQNSVKVKVSLCGKTATTINGSASTDGKTAVIYNGWQEKTFIFELTDTQAANDYLDFESEDISTSDDNKIYIRHLKIERGNTATGFCESDEDIANVGTKDLLSLSISPNVNSSDYTINGEKYKGYSYHYKYTDIEPTTPTATNNWLQPIQLVNNGTIKLEAGKIYTLSYYAYSSQAGTRIFHSFHANNGYGINIVTNVGVIYTGGGNGAIREGVEPQGNTFVTLSSSWKQYFVYFYVAYNVSAAALKELVVMSFNRVTGEYNNTSAYVYMADIHFQEGYVMSPASYSSLIGQTARRLSLAQYTGTKKAGIDIYNGKVDILADNFTITNNNGDVNMSVNETGDVEFRGVIKCTYGYNIQMYNPRATLVTENYIKSDTDYYLFGQEGTSSSRYILYLPEASMCPGRRIEIVNSFLASDASYVQLCAFPYDNNLDLYAPIAVFTSTETMTTMYDIGDKRKIIAWADPSLISQGSGQGWRILEIDKH